MNPKQQYIRQAIKCVPRTLHKVIQECIPLHKAKPLKNHMFNITRSKATKEFSASTCNYMLQSRISSSALETCPARHETKPCPRTWSELFFIRSARSCWLNFLKSVLNSLTKTETDPSDFSHTHHSSGEPPEGKWMKNLVLRVCRGVTLWDLQAQARAVPQLFQCHSTKQINSLNHHLPFFTNYHPKYLTWSALPGLCMRKKWIVVRNDTCYISVLIRAR